MPRVRVPIIASRESFRLPLGPVDLAHLREPRPAVYVFTNRLGALYIGQAGGANGPAARVVAHLRGEMLRPSRRIPTRLLVLWLRCRCALDHVERRMIAALRPILNRSRPRGRRTCPRPGRWCRRCMG